MRVMTSTGAQDTQPFHFSTKKEKEVLALIFEDMILRPSWLKNVKEK